MAANNNKKENGDRAGAYKRLSAAALILAVLTAAASLLFSHFELRSLEKRLIPPAEAAEAALRSDDLAAAAEAAGELIGVIDGSEAALKFIVRHNDIFDLRRLAEEAHTLITAGEKEESMTALIGLKSLVSMLAECDRVSLGNIF